MNIKLIFVLSKLLSHKAWKNVKRDRRKEIVRRERERTRKRGPREGQSSLRHSTAKQSRSAHKKPNRIFAVANIISSVMRRNIRVQQFLIIFLSAFELGSLNACTYFISTTKSTDDTRQELLTSPNPTTPNQVGPTILTWLQSLENCHMCCMVLVVAAAPAAARTPAQTTHTYTLTSTQTHTKTLPPADCMS